VLAADSKRWWWIVWGKYWSRESWSMCNCDSQVVSVYG